jgi:hypothetical protein
MKTREAFLEQVRAEAALSAYDTALIWLRSYPAGEVERRLGLMIETTRAIVRRCVTPVDPDPDERYDRR